MRFDERLRARSVAIIVASGSHIRRRLLLGRLEPSPGDEADSDEDDHATVNASADVAGLTATVRDDVARDRGTDECASRLEEERHRHPDADGAHVVRQGGDSCENSSFSRQFLLEQNAETRPAVIRALRVVRLTRWKHRDKGALESTKQDRPDDDARAVHHGRDPAEDHDAGDNRGRNEEIEWAVRIGKVLRESSLASTCVAQRMASARPSAICTRQVRTFGMVRPSTLAALSMASE
jgi:hypothetical protein